MEQYKLHPETYNNLLKGSQQNAEILRDSIELLERSIEATNKANAFGEIIVVDDAGNEVKRLSMPKGDPSPLHQRLGQQKERLALVEGFIRELIDENEESVVQ